MGDFKKILFIRRDNIGDLICTTPAIRAARIAYPGAKIAALVNSYNAGAIVNNPDVDEVYAYEKAKHAGDKGAVGVFVNNLRILRKIRSERFDAAIGCGYSYSQRVARFTRITGARVRIGAITAGVKRSLYYTDPVAEPQTPIHEVEAVMRLMAPLGITGEIPGTYVRPDSAEKEKVARFLASEGAEAGRAPIVFHISSRKPANRWPVENFITLGNLIGQRLGARILLLWSPGESDNPMHPGDDEKARVVAAGLKVRPMAYKTGTLAQLIAAISAGSIVVCCDGGAMHLAAALSRPIVTIWGATDQRRWSPWGVDNVILQRGGLASNITAEEAFAAFLKLYGKPGA